MASFTIPYNKVSYIGRQSNFNANEWDAYWGATITGDYTNQPYTLVIKKVAITARWKHHVTGKYGDVDAGTGSGTLTVYSYTSSGKIYRTVSIPISLTGSPTRDLKAGQYCNLSATRSGTYNLPLSPDGGRLRAYLRVGTIDYGMIYSSGTYPVDYVPTNIDLNISVNSNGINNITASLNSYVITDLASYNFIFSVYTDAMRTKLAWTKTGTNINEFALIWDDAVPNTTYYWSLEATGINSRTGANLTMATKSGVVNTQTPYINGETFTYQAVNLDNGHWTPRTQVDYSISDTGDATAGLYFAGYEMETSINGLSNNTKSTRFTSMIGTIRLDDITKFYRLPKPRDLVYIKVRTVYFDKAGREFYSNWFGILIGQPIYNKFHIYLTNPNVENELRVNSRLNFENQNDEKYVNIGEVI